MVLPGKSLQTILKMPDFLYRKSEFYMRIVSYSKRCQYIDGHRVAPGVTLSRDG